jgi:hypothetical protein
MRAVMPHVTSTQTITPRGTFPLAASYDVASNVCQAPIAGRRERRHLGKAVQVDPYEIHVESAWN